MLLTKENQKQNRCSIFFNSLNFVILLQMNNNPLSIVALKGNSNMF